MPRPWSESEISAIVADYFAMLTCEIEGRSYVKAERNRAMQRLTGRSHGSIEMKHQNISAVLCALHSTYIDGYKPLSNFQDSLRRAVIDHLHKNPSVADAIRSEADSPPPDPSAVGILDRLVTPPRTVRAKGRLVTESLVPRTYIGPDIDFVAREARNVSLGAKGEKWVIEYERARLISVGKEALADRIEHVSVDVGPAAGFDIRSFERDGSDRFIEVKTTGGPIAMPFYVTANELGVSRRVERRYHLYRAFRFARDPRLFILRGTLDQVCRLTPVTYRADVA